MAKYTKFIVIGWDGATFDILEPLVAQGRLPNFANLMQQGTWGRLESTIPALTPTAWTSIITGVNPGKHGIFDAILYSRQERKAKFVNGTFRKVKSLWSILSDRGRTAGALNVPVTYPPDKINGFVVPGMFTPPGLRDFTHPVELLAELEDVFGGYTVECRQVDDPQMYLKLLLEMVEFRTKVALYLMNQGAVDFFFVTFIASDRAQHFFWKYLDPSHPENKRYSQAIAEVYERLDECLGAILEKAGSETNVMMVSDHGAGRLYNGFFLNNWLMRNGYLHLKYNPVEVIKGKQRSRFSTAMRKAVKQLIPSRLVEQLRVRKQNNAEDDINLFLSLIDWDKTVAFSEGMGGGIYLNPRAVTSEGYHRVPEEIIGKLKGLVGPDGNRVIRDIKKREEIYSGDFVKEAPELIVNCSRGYQVFAANEFLYFDRKYEDRLFIPHRWSAKHEPDGIFLLKGSGVKKNQEITGCRVVDIAPTVLYLLDEEIPEYMDGKVLTDAIEKEFLQTKRVRYTSEDIREGRAEMSLSAEDQRAIADRLKDLGYME